MTDGLTLVVRRTIAASAQELFDAWTQPARLVQWWGPEGVVCDEAQVDLRVGGKLRISNRLPDGRIVWITGEFQRIEAPRLLVYSWRLEPGPDGLERVTVRFDERDGKTEVVVLHERIGDEATRVQHRHGWEGCLDGLQFNLDPRSGRG